MIEPATDDNDSNDEAIQIECSGSTERPDGGMGLLKVEVYPIPAEMLRPLAEHMAAEAYKFLGDQGMKLEPPIEVPAPGRVLN